MKQLINLGLLLLVAASTSLAQAAERYVTLNDAQTITTVEPITTVYIANPAIADYQVVNEHLVVVTGQQVGQTRLLIYGKAGALLTNERIIVDLDLTQVRRQLKLYYPNLAVQVESVGQQVAVSGLVNSELQRDEIYQLVANILGRKHTTRFDKSKTLSFDESGLTEPQALIFARNFRWEGIIEKLQINSVQQVNVKISVAQVTEDFSETLGFDWGTLGSGEFLFTEFKAADLTTLITALADEQIAEVLAEPNLTVLSGESASFLAGGEVPMIVTNDSNVNVTFKEVGVKLELTAKVMSEQKVRMQIAPEVSAVERYIQAAGIEVPQLSTRRAMTTIELGDGESFMLGGLMSTDDIEQLQKIPLLGDIPVLGSLFRKSVTTRKKTELVIIATVNLVKPLTPQQVRLPYMAKSSTLSRLLNYEVPSRKAHDKSADSAVKQDEAVALELLANGGFIE